MFRIFPFAALPLLAGCTAITALGEVTTPLDAYDLTYPEEVPQARKAGPLHLVVEVPTTGGAIDSERVLIRPTPLQAQYLPDARWTETAPILMQTVMLRTLEETDAFRYVGRRPLGGSGDYALISELTDFHAAVASEDSALVRVQMTARLVREEDAAIIAARTFSVTSPVPSLETLALVNGFDAATDALLRQMAGWILASLDIPAAGG